MDLLKALILVSEKAANIARVCRQNDHLFQLLVQKKKSSEANPRFVEDFKTLADVLIQEMVKYDIKNQFQELTDIRGEENNFFENKLGARIYVEIKEFEKETSDLLEKVLNGDQIAAKLLSTEVHRKMVIEDIKIELPEEKFELNLEELGIWIDPIDCTAEYINGGEGDYMNNIHLNGLKCVTILIGVFHKRLGFPVMGVINRPFMEKNDSIWPQQCIIWGVSFQNINLNNGINLGGRNDIVCVSSSEHFEITNKLKEKGYTVVKACGAGYKILTVILGLADAYILTKGTTFKWDTCAPHSILKSVGGDITHFEEAFKENDKGIKYFVEENNCNSTGIIAYKNKDVLIDIINIFKNERNM